MIRPSKNLKWIKKMADAEGNKCVSVGTVERVPWTARPEVRERLKQEIRAFLGKEPGLDQLDLAERTEISLKFACELCDELVQEGKIRVIPDGRRKH